jgi:hypothetical protein
VNDNHAPEPAHKIRTQQSLQENFTMHNFNPINPQPPPVAPAAAKAIQAVSTQAHPLTPVYRDVLEATQKVFDFITANPEIAPEKIQDFNQQLVALIESVGDHGKANQARDYANTILDRELRAGGGDDNQSAVVNNNSFGEVFDGFDDLAEKQR